MSMPGKSGGHGGLETDDAFALLSSSVRRSVLLALVDEESVPVSTVADQVVGADGDRDHVSTTLRHVHLPKLMQMGVVEPTPEEERVSLTDLARSHSFLLRLAAVDQLPEAAADSPATAKSD